MTWSDVFSEFGQSLNSFRTTNYRDAWEHFTDALERGFNEVKSRGYKKTVEDVYVGMAKLHSHLGGRELYHFGVNGWEDAYRGNISDDNNILFSTLYLGIDLEEPLSILAKKYVKRGPIRRLVDRLDLPEYRFKLGDISFEYEWHEIGAGIFELVRTNNLDYAIEHPREFLYEWVLEGIEPFGPWMPKTSIVKAATAAIKASEQVPV